MNTTRSRISRKAVLLRHAAVLALATTRAIAAEPGADEFPLAIFSHICETPTLHEVLRRHTLSVENEARPETRHDEPLSTLADHVFRHARIRVELYAAPGSDEVLVLDGATPLADGVDAAVLLRARLGEESLTVESRSNPTAVVRWRRGPEARMTIEVRDGTVRLTVPEEPDEGILSRELAAEEGVYLAIPAGSDSCDEERCGPTALDIFGDGEESRGWFEDVGPEWTARRLVGLTRLIGFRRHGDPSRLPAEVRAWIPPQLSVENLHLVPAFVLGADDRETSLTIRDFRLRSWPESLDVTLRQVVNTSHPRAAEQVWAVYSRGRLGELWFFSPVVDQNHAKMLAPYEIREVVDDGDSEVVFRTCGEMHRPGGYGWMQGKEFVFFGPTHEGLELLYIKGDFYISYDPDGKITASVEAEIAKGDELPSLETRSVEADPGILEYCGYTDPNLLETEFTCEQWRKIAHCIVAQGNASVSVRQTWEQSWIEVEDETEPEQPLSSERF